MTGQRATDNETSTPKRRKWWIVGAGAGVCLLSWVGVALGLLLDVDFSTRLILVTGAAVTTESLFWLVAAVFGLTLFETRQRIWRAVRDAPKRLLEPRS